MKANKTFFILKRGPTRFNLAPTYLHRMENQDYVVLWVENSLSVVDFSFWRFFWYIFNF